MDDLRDWLDDSKAWYHSDPVRAKAAAAIGFVVASLIAWVL